MWVPSASSAGAEFTRSVVEVICVSEMPVPVSLARKISKLRSAFPPGTKSRSEKNAIRSPAALMDGPRLKPSKMPPSELVI